MDASKSFAPHKLKELLEDFCGNPTPFKIIKELSEEDTIQTALEVFNSSDAKRKVIGIKTKSGKSLQIGENELKVILSRLQQQSNQ